jgi:hypothetical protein
MPADLVPEGMAASGEHEEEWVEISVAVELEPWPSHYWFLFWREGDLEWPDGFDEPVLDGRRLIFNAPEGELQGAWDAVKARVTLANELHREQFPRGEEDADRGDDTLYAALRERAQRRIDELR